VRFPPLVGARFLDLFTLLAVRNEGSYEGSCEGIVPVCVGAGLQPGIFSLDPSYITVQILEYPGQTDSFPTVR